ncbi:MAG TPA: hypothetical protein VHC20_04160 [Candidatus Paceibacterota bacterium]|nr:hypothetical protein [Candidatus Paceibacterota bacterium]
MTFVRNFLLKKIRANGSTYISHSKRNYVTNPMAKKKKATKKKAAKKKTTKRRK